MACPLHPVVFCFRLLRLAQVFGRQRDRLPQQPFWACEVCDGSSSVMINSLINIRWMQHCPLEKGDSRIGRGWVEIGGWEVGESLDSACAFWGSAWWCRSLLCFLFVFRGSNEIDVKTVNSKNEILRCQKGAWHRPCDKQGHCHVMASGRMLGLARNFLPVWFSPQVLVWKVL